MQIFATQEFTNPIEIIEAFDNESFIEAFRKIEILRKLPDIYLLGYVRYEAKEVFLEREIKSEYPLLYFEAFQMKNGKWKMENCHCEKPCLQGDEAIQKISSPFTVHRSLIDFPTYAKAIQQIKTEIANGNTYQVNYTYDWEIQSEIDGFELYKSILPKQTTPYNAYIKNDYEEILSFSPELFFELEGNKIKTKPMKGTVKRGETAEKDKKNIEFLKNDVKNRAENVMIVDLLRNDLGKIAKTGTVKVEKLFEVETHKTVHQMTSEISAEIEENTTLFEIFKALFPCGSVTGAPKINTMEIIDSIEQGKREVYCGAIGLITPEKTVFSVPIRILQKQFRHCEERSDAANSSASNFICRVGGAIVWDSTPEDEWEETLTKIKFLKNDDFKLVETMLVKDGKILYENDHLERMTQSAKELGFNYRKQETGNREQKNCILRLLLDKNGVIETQELPLEPIKTNLITISDTPVDSRNLLLYHKTDFRPWYDDAMKKIKQGEIFDEIFFNEKNELTEGARSNIILQIDGEFFTPPVESGLLNGILRQKLITEGANFTAQNSRLKSKITEKILYLKDLQKAEKVFCINSVRGIVEVEISCFATSPLAGEVCFQLEQKSAKTRKQGEG